MKPSLSQRMTINYEEPAQTFLPRRNFTVIRLILQNPNQKTKPFDKIVLKMLVLTAQHLCKLIKGCKIGYVFGKEINLILTDFENLDTEPYLSGNAQDIVSKAAGVATAFYNDNMLPEIPNMENAEELMGKFNFVHFTAKVFSIPTKTEAINYLISRQNECILKGVHSLARHFYSAEELSGTVFLDQVKMLWEKKVDWNKICNSLRNGTSIVQAYEEKMVDYNTFEKYVTAHPNQGGKGWYGSFFIPSITWENISSPVFKVQENSFLDQVLPVND